MQALLLGFAALALGLAGLNVLASANVAVFAQYARTAAGVLVLAAAALLLLRGALPFALVLAILGLWLVAGTPALDRLRGNAGTPGRTSRIVTDHLEMELDHDTGEMRGRVLKGLFKDRDIASLSPTDMALLWQDCRHTDPQSAQLVEAYLDRVHPSWREDMARGESDMSRGPDGRMDVEEALDILGLKRGADAEDIRRAHRNLMLKLHPDRGGSTYLAAKINEAKDVALEALES